VNAVILPRLRNPFSNGLDIRQINLFTKGKNTTYSLYFSIILLSVV